MMRTILLLLLLNCTNVFGQIYELTINSQILGDEVLELGSVITIDKQKQKIEYSTASNIYVQSVTYDLGYKGFSFDGVELIVNFNIANNPFGKAGSLNANFTTKKLRFQDWAIEGRGNSGVYTFSYKVQTKEDIEKAKKEEEERRLAIERKRRNEDLNVIALIDSAINKNQPLKAIELFYELKYPDLTKYSKIKLTETITTSLIKNPIEIKVNTQIIDSLLFTNKINKYNLPCGELTVLSSLEKGIIILNGKGEEVIQVSNKPHQMSFEEFELPVAFNQEIKIYEETQISADELLKLYILNRTNSETIEEAIKKMKKIKSSSNTWEYLVAPDPIPVKETNVWLAPNKAGSRMEYQGSVIKKSYFDGESGAEWNTQTGKKEMTAEEIAAKKKSTGIFPEMNYKTSGMNYELMGIEEQNGVKMYVLKLNKGEEEYFQFYSTSDFMKMKTYWIVEVDGETDERVTTFSDYKDVKGIKFAHAGSFSCSRFTGKKTAIEVNGKIDYKSFK